MRDLQAQPRCAGWLCWPVWLAYCPLGSPVLQVQRAAGLRVWATAGLQTLYRGSGTVVRFLCRPDGAPALLPSEAPQDCRRYRPQTRRPGLCYLGQPLHSCR